jgi:hypothetical protein
MTEREKVVPFLLFCLDNIPNLRGKLLNRACSQNTNEKTNKTKYYQIHKKIINPIRDYNFICDINEVKK